jgi:hypothetical protein
MIIFLDIDGVLVNREVLMSRERDKFYAPAVAALNSFCAIPECRIVVSSAWRVGRSINELQKLFSDNNVALEIIGKTDSTKLNGKRGEEILDWIEEHRYDGPYIVIDDEDFDIAPYIPAHNIILVKDGLPDEGLTRKHISDYIERLRVLNGATVIVDPWWQIRPFITYVDQMINTKTKRRKHMCSPQDFSVIETVVGELVGMRRTFTGEDVYNRIHNKHIRRAVKLDGVQESARGVSMEVRKMFNSRHSAFAGYGSTLVPHDHGPVLYFALPHHAKSKANKIAATLSPVPAP